MGNEEAIPVDVNIRDIIPSRINRFRMHFKLSLLRIGNSFDLLKESAQSGIPDNDTQVLREEIRTIETCRKLSDWAIQREMIAPEYRERIGDMLGSLLMPNQDSGL